jgi:4-hydroxybenzoate polyprenyltransferase
MKTKTYYFIITVFALIGVAVLFENYPFVIAISAFGIGIGYKEYIKDEKEDDESTDLLDDYN